MRRVACVPESGAVEVDFDVALSGVLGYSFHFLDGDDLTHEGVFDRDDPCWRCMLIAVIRDDVGDYIF